MKDDGVTKRIITGCITKTFRLLKTTLVSSEWRFKPLEVSASCCSPTKPLKVSWCLLCRTCAEMNKQQERTSTVRRPEPSRASGSRKSWTALRLSYWLVEMTDVWHFEECSNRVFKDYRCTFMTIIKETSGPPEWVKDRRAGAILWESGVFSWTQRTSNWIHPRERWQNFLKSLSGKFTEEKSSHSDYLGEWQITIWHSLLFLPDEWHGDDAVEASEGMLGAS